MRREENRRADHRDIEQYGRERRRGKVFPCIQNPRGERDQRHENDVREHDLRHDARVLVALRADLHRAGHDPHHARYAHNAQNGDQRHHPKQQSRGAIHQYLGLRLAVRRFALAEYRNERL